MSKTSCEKRNPLSKPASNPSDASQPNSELGSFAACESEDTRLIASGDHTSDFLLGKDISKTGKGEDSNQTGSEEVLLTVITSHGDWVSEEKKQVEIAEVARLSTTPVSYHFRE